MLDLIARAWWIVALRGVLTIVVGLAALVIPHDSQGPLRILFGSFAIVDGLVAAIASLQFARVAKAWRWLGGEGTLGIVLGLIALAAPGLPKSALAALIAVWAMGTGGLTIVSALRLRRHIASVWLWIASGIASIVFGAVIAIFPLVTIALWTSLVLVYALVAGVALLGLSFFLRRLLKRRSTGSVR